ncbi:hypothetical protein SAMN05192559_105251 [Halobacillus karajensis]|uniref:Uncharacterized protein n=1 Tax=Halobacillus karajensis TaxID=195088 RepID=A0A024P5W3_9BACI|nr:hypothetical protein [Halobacillus karajensis]CDQ20485.1 hypothetical protein BN982_02827 [Halobacillus karajensis]CDQ24046.1 hypothetical protein BN983_02310 [Halobacillus karajensis]CDQ27524.1 hypothetical protein BN981_01791 [Halobacillus karajensis]SEH90998.1 hypothetical protein SAMN05192559_105251 [Halobacillus karajensis]
MSRYLDRIEPEDVRFLMDFSEFKTFVIDMLGDARDLVQIHIDYDLIEETENMPLIRPMVHLSEVSNFTEEDRHTLLATGFSIDQEPFVNGDYAMKQIFGPEYTILAATEDDDGAFFTIEIPFRNYQQEIKQMRPAHSRQT